ncbi:branched-chain-amino-acid transaminase [soil metagenome]
MLQKFDPKNKDIKAYVNGKLYPREEAKISVFDSVVQGGDAVWEGLRVYKGGVFCLDRHLQRLQESSHALKFENIPPLPKIKEALFKTLEANQMYDEVHVRLTLTRGEKITSGMDPRLNQSGCGLIILAEWKPLVYDNKTGIIVITSAVRRNNPNYLDSKIHHNNLLNNILAKIQANIAGADAAVMLDDNGFISELNDTNLFMVKNKVVFTPHSDSCLPGITRGLVIEIANINHIPVLEKNISLTEIYNADEVFATGTMGELTPVLEIDGRKIINNSTSTMLAELQNHFHHLVPKYCEKIVS